MKQQYLLLEYVMFAANFFYDVVAYTKYFYPVIRAICVA